MPQTQAEAAYITAERLRKVVKASAWDTPKGMLCVTMRLGIAEMHGTRINSTEKLIDCADPALYQSKGPGATGQKYIKFLFHRRRLDDNPHRPNARNADG
jgi:PleD family two-component response regulator